MPLTLLAAAGDPAANAYATVSEADAAAGYRMSGPAVAWADLDAPQKIQALVTTAQLIDTADFASEPLTDDQAMAFPRLAWPDIPDAIRRANIEYAFWYAAQAIADPTADPLNPVPSNIKREKTGPLETEYFAPAVPAAQDVARFPAVVQALLAPFLARASTGVWGSSVAVRAS